MHPLTHTTVNIILSYRCTDVGPFLEQHLALTDQESKHTTQIVITFGNLSSDTNFSSSNSSVLILFDQV